MQALELPNELKGDWAHALFLTYSVHISFLEHALWKQLNEIPNRLILADGNRYLESCIQCAGGDLTRRLNNQYVAGGIFAPHAAHGKVILLTNAEEGRLFVGSGNLGLLGYASGGELFTKYEYPSQEDGQLAAFIAAREVIEGLMARGYVDPLPRTRLQLLLEETPWLFRPVPGSARPVRHNLERSHLEQLRESIGADPVEELWVMAPFYDAEATALGELVKSLRPRLTVVLVQPGRTSVDGDALQRVQKRYPKVEVRPFKQSADDVYVHAKLYLAKLKKKAICLQGSPNVSRAAMLSPEPKGNLELANLLVGGRDHFDHLFEALQIDKPVKNLDSLDLAYQPIEPPAEGIPAGWALTGAEWRKENLWLDYRGTIPDLKDAKLGIGRELFPLQVRDSSAGRLLLKLSKEAQALLDRPIPVVVRWDAADITSNPIFVWNLDALAAAMSTAESADKLADVGDLSLDDEELENLLFQLEKTLILDRRDIWRLTGAVESASSAQDDEDDGPMIAYGSIDYEALRRHPKLRQYATSSQGRPGYERSRLQIILSGITQHFTEYVDVASSLEEAARAVAEEGATQEIDVEVQPEAEEELERRRLTVEQRVRRILKGFIGRYLRGIRSSGFQDFVGYEVMIQNYVVFSHILWRLIVTERLEEDFVIDALLRIWSFFWGSDDSTGYLKGLSHEEQGAATKWLRQYHADSTMLAGLYSSSYTTSEEELDELRFRLRDLLRHLLQTGQLDPPARVFEEARDLCCKIFVVDPPSCSEMVDEIGHTVDFDTQRTFLESLERMHGYPRDSCSFEKPKVYRDKARQSVPVDCLTIHASTPSLTKETATSILEAWMLFEPELDYYRITSRSGEVLWYDVTTGNAFWVPKRTDDMESLNRPRAASVFEPILTKLKRRATRVDGDRGVISNHAAG